MNWKSSSQINDIVNPNITSNVEFHNRYNIIIIPLLEKSSKHIIVSKPLSLNLSAIDIPIKGNVNDNKEEEEEWEDKIKQYQLMSHE